MEIKFMPMEKALRMAGGPLSVMMARPITDKTTVGEMQEAAAFFMLESESQEKLEEKTEPEPEKTPEPKPKKAAPKKKNAGNTNAKKEIDDGKIRACYEGGRSVSWTADEMGLAPQTIINHLTKMGIYKTKAERGETNG